VTIADAAELVAPDSFDDFVAARGPALMRTAYMLTGSRDAAEDLVQSALARVYPRWTRIAGMDRPEAYVRRVLVTTHLKWLRVRRVAEQPLDEQAGPAARALTAADPAAAHAERDVVWLALAALPRRQRAVIVLRYYEDLPEAEVAAVLGITVGTVKSQTAKAMARLRDHPALNVDRRRS
jgi:RNA polymerase sigma-70 factor (sigma-E family)